GAGGATWPAACDTPPHPVRALELRSPTPISCGTAAACPPSIPPRVRCAGGAPPAPAASLSPRAEPLLFVAALLTLPASSAWLTYHRSHCSKRVTASYSDRR